MVTLKISNVEKAWFIRRLNRFVAEVEVDGLRIQAHVPSSGRMAELLVPEAEVYVARSTDPRRRTGCSLLMVKYGNILVSIDSLMPNRLIHKALKARSLPWFSSFTSVNRETSFKASRFDFLLRGAEEKCFLEVKSVTLAEDGVARFPDAPTARGARHLRELISAAGEGHRAAVVFVAQREDVACFTPNDPQDPVFGRALRDAAGAGVEVYALACKVSLSQIALDRTITVDL